MSPSDRSPLRIGLVGCGRWGRHILRDLIAGGASVVVVARSAQSIARAEAGGAAAIVATTGELPGDLDGYVVAAPSQLHLPMVEDLLPRDRPIFVEKPLGNDFARAQRLPAAARHLVYTMQKWRYHPGIKEISEIAHSGELGPLWAIRSVRVGWGNPHWGVDTVWHLLPHDMAIALHLLGRLPPLRMAMADPLGPPGSGVVAALGGERTEVLIEVSSCHPTYRRAVIAAFAEGSAELADGWDETIRIVRDGVEPELRPVGNAMPLALEIDAFLDHLRGGPPPMTPLSEELLILERIAEVRAAAGLTPDGMTGAGR